MDDLQYAGVQGMRIYFVVAHNFIYNEKVGASATRVLVGCLVLK